MFRSLSSWLSSLTLSYSISTHNILPLSYFLTIIFLLLISLRLLFFLCLLFILCIFSPCPFIWITLFFLHVFHEFHLTFLLFHTLPFFKIGKCKYIPPIIVRITIIKVLVRWYVQHTTYCYCQNLFLYFYFFLYHSCSHANSKTNALNHFKFLSMIDHHKVWALTLFLSHHRHVTSSRRHFVNSSYQ